jgi:homocysteine S-methyltransferase
VQCVGDVERRDLKPAFAHTAVPTWATSVVERPVDNCGGKAGAVLSAEHGAALLVRKGGSMGPVTAIEPGKWLTDSGLETDLIFHHDVPLPDFAAFTLIGNARGERLLQDYFADHARVAAHARLGIILETPTWRASPDWGRRQGYDLGRLADTNRRAVELVRQALSTVHEPLHALVSGCIGPRGDGYSAAHRLTEDQAQEYHAWQVDVLAGAGADLVSALTMTHVEEAVGLTRAAVAAGVEVVISFTIETDGALPDGTSLRNAIARVDEETASAPAYYMVNCAHPDHIRPAAGQDGTGVERLRGVRANASRMSHAELDDAAELDDGDPEALAVDLLALRELLPSVNVLGGCCGTDARHIAALARAWC